MSHEDNQNQPKDEKSIAEIEDELSTLQKKIVRQTDNVKDLIKKKATGKHQPIPAQHSDIDLNSEAAKYTLEQSQAEFFASIATLNTIISNYQQDRLDPQIYESELQKIINDILKFKLILKKKDFDLIKFFKQERISKKFTLAYNKLRSMGFFA